MVERIFNLFIYINGDVIEQLGVVIHEMEGLHILAQSEQPF